MHIDKKITNSENPLKNVPYKFSKQSNPLLPSNSIQIHVKAHT